MTKISVVDHKGWSQHESETFVPNVIKFQEKLVPGMYDVGYNPTIGGYYLKQTALADHDIFEFSSTKTTEVVKDIQNFWARKHLFKQYSFPYKRGILLYGPPGCGKSSSIALICKELMKLDGLVIKFNGDFIEGLRLVKKVQPEVPIVCLMEDLDYLLENHDVSEILNLLDGVEDTIDNVVYLATTNNPKKLPQNIKNRPSRFDRRFEFKEPDVEARKQYLEILFNKSNTSTKEKLDLAKWAKDTKGFSFAHLKELFISVVLFGNKYDLALKELNAMKKTTFSSDNSNEDY